MAMLTTALVIYHLIAICYYSRRLPGTTTNTTTTTGAAGDAPSSTMVANTPVVRMINNSIPAHKYRKGGISGNLVGEDGVCAVCLGEFEDGEELRTLPECLHSKKSKIPFNLLKSPSISPPFLSLPPPQPPFPPSPAVASLPAKFQSGCSTPSPVRNYLWPSPPHPPSSDLGMPQRKIISGCRPLPAKFQSGCLPSLEFESERPPPPRPPQSCDLVLGPPKVAIELAESETRSPIGEEGGALKPIWRWGRELAGVGGPTPRSQGLKTQMGDPKLAGAGGQGSNLIWIGSYLFDL
ncbi:hypothetical protein TIFTF001_026346 [Ficus carica]|uniref:Uncharacterized protein n=1 Tax=Ficus carica TaxID=3494 RepID=A0AA88IYJ6_FICCA|nr:hypothetical protein TIFTF001_026346 [Ficus carica]